MRYTNPRTHSLTHTHLLAVPRFRLNTYGSRAFLVARPMAWNSLPDFIRDPTSSTDCFRRLLKTYYAVTSVGLGKAAAVTSAAMVGRCREVTRTLPVTAVDVAVVIADSTVI